MKTKSGDSKATSEQRSSKTDSIAGGASETSKIPSVPFRPSIRSGTRTASHVPKPLDRLSDSLDDLSMTDSADESKQISGYYQAERGTPLESSTTIPSGRVVRTKPGVVTLYPDDPIGTGSVSLSPEKSKQKGGTGKSKREVSFESPEPEVDEKMEHVRVVVRVRPMSAVEQADNHTNIIQIDESTQSISVINPHNIHIPPKRYTFDHVFDENSSQLDVYCQTARPIVDSVINGYNGTILAYGQTGTGKTHTMTGQINSTEMRGIIPNVFAHIFGHISQANDDKKFIVFVTYLQIYNENIHDLITDIKNLKIRETSSIGPYVSGLTGYVCTHADEINEILELGNQHRVVASTNMNEESSRSHTILQITIETSTNCGNGKQRLCQGKLSLVDLAGSERQSKTNATGTRLKEASQINLSLTVLASVISALVDGRSTYIPYRNSKLTRLLKDSLGGNSKTVMIATVGPASYNYDETISTLRYANRAKNIKNSAKRNEDPKSTLIKILAKEIEDLRKQMEELPTEIVEEEVVVEEEEEEISVSAKACGSTDVRARRIKNPEIVQKRQEWEALKKESVVLHEKLSKVEEKILVGGENIIEKFENQAKLIQTNAQKIEARRFAQEQMLQARKNLEAERIDVTEKYNTLSEEVEGKSKKYNKIIDMIKAAETELQDLQQEQQREFDAIMDNVKTTQRELKLANLIITEHIPRCYLDKITASSHYNEDIGEWQLRGIAYSGNHMRKHEETMAIERARVHATPTLSSAFVPFSSYESNRQILHLSKAYDKTSRSRSDHLASPSKERTHKSHVP